MPFWIRWSKSELDFFFDFVENFVHKMALEDIERLKEKVSKDPASKLFVPLAEEYKKAGMYDEAIDILINGLDRHPGYLSARVSLGKIYMERGMFDQAKNEFEKVVNIIPDNLYAHKKLAEIYRDTGERDRSIEEFKAVLQLNPTDEWALTNLAKIESTGKPPQPVSEEGIEILEEIPAEAAEEAEELEELAEISVSENTESWVSSEVAEEVQVPQQEETIPETYEEAEEEVLPDLSVPEEDLKEWEAADMGSEIEGEEEAVIEAHAITEEETAEESFEEAVSEAFASIEEVRESKTALSIADADQYILEDRYSEAMNVYTKLISREPGNKHVLQRIEELKALLRLLGKDKEELISRLEQLLEGFKKRRDEFFGSS
ncbi:MAG: tetratricopeptide repeat protein [Nitrospirota bacterium]